MFKIDPISRRLVKASRGHGPLILMYHSVTPGREAPAWIWSVALERFVEQIDLLRTAGWRFCKVSDLRADTGLHEQTIAITFDDGYLDNLPAFEALAARGLPATWFVVSANVGRPAAWQDDTTQGWQILDRGQLIEMVQSGMEIGGHSRHHCHLAEMPSSEWADQIRGCRSELEGLLQSPITSFAYPYGAYTDEVVQMTRDAGYLAACTTRAGHAFTDGDPMLLRRLAVYSSDSLSSFARKVGLMKRSDLG